MAHDGVDRRDWRRVEALAAAVAAAARRTTRTEEARRRKRLLALLSRLERKYGAEPAILATRADYVVSQTRRREMLRRAYELARRRRDTANLWLIACSLTEHYIEDELDRKAARRWLDIMRKHLSVSGDRDGKRWARQLENELRRLK